MNNQYEQSLKLPKFANSSTTHTQVSITHANIRLRSSRLSIVVQQHHMPNSQAEHSSTNYLAHSFAKAARWLGDFPTREIVRT